MLDDPRLPLASALVLLVVTGQVLWRIRRRRLVRRQRAEAMLRQRHLTWVARQEQAARGRDRAERDRAAETARQEQQAAQQQALTITQQFDAALTRYRHPSAATPAPPSGRSPETVSAAGGPRAETYTGATAGQSSGTAETTSAKGTSQRKGPTETELQRLVYSLITVDQAGWRRWQGSPDRKGYPRVWPSGVRKWTQAYRLVYRWEQGIIPKGWTIDHTCGLKDCMDHLECVTRAENLRRRHARAWRTADRPCRLGAPLRGAVCLRGR